MGWLIARDVVYRELGFGGFEDYVVERLDLSPRTARRLVRLARAPEAVATAFREGRLTLLAAEAILRGAPRADEPWNLTTLCAWHNQRGVHGRGLKIRGRDPDDLIFELGVGRFRSGDGKIAD